MGETIPMWRVQKEGCKDGLGFPPGTVTFPGLDSTPDSEFIASGENQKRPNAVSIGRQGNFLHWGFHASPEYLTDEAQLVFINAIHYIHQFDGYAPVADKIERLVTRDHIDDLMWVISDEGFAELQSVFKDNPRVQPDRSALLERFVVESVRERYKEDWDAYISYYKVNRPFLFPAMRDGNWQMLIVDEDAKLLGLANSDPELLDKCISLLESGTQSDLATRVLRRYTNESFTMTSEWRDWFETNRRQLALSEESGFKFLVFPHAQTGTTAAVGESVLPREEGPVQFLARIAPVGGDSSNAHQFQFVVSAIIAEGWHVYAETPADSPFSSIRVELENGVATIGELKRPAGKPHPIERDTAIYEDTVELVQVFRVDSDEVRSISVRVSYQACNDIRCLRPMSKLITVELPHDRPERD